MNWISTTEYTINPIEINLWNHTQSNRMSIFIHNLTNEGIILNVYTRLFTSWIHLKVVSNPIINDDPEFNLLISNVHWPGSAKRNLNTLKVSWLHSYYIFFSIRDGEGRVKNFHRQRSVHDVNSTEAECKVTITAIGHAPWLGNWEQWSRNWLVHHQNSY